MTCANVGATILAAIILVLTIWPNIFSAAANVWIISIAAVLIIVIVWAGCECRWCKKMPEAKRR